MKKTQHKHSALTRLLALMLCLCMLVSVLPVGTVFAETQVLYKNDFEAGEASPLNDFEDITGGLTTYVGKQTSQLVEEEGRGQVWKLANGGGSGLDDLAFAKRLAGDYADVAFSFDMKTTAANESQVRFRSTEEGDSGYMVTMIGDTLTFTKRNPNGERNQENEPVCENNVVTLAAGTRTNGWHNYKIAINGKTITMWIDGNQVASLVETNTTAPEWASGGISFIGWGTTIYIDNLKVETIPVQYANSFDDAASLNDLADVTGGIVTYTVGQKNQIAADAEKGQVWELGSAAMEGGSAYAKRLAGDYADFTFSFYMKTTAANESQVRFRSTEEGDSGYMVTMIGDTLTFTKRNPNGERDKENEPVCENNVVTLAAGTRTDGWHNYKIAINGKNITTWIDGEQVASLLDTNTTAPEWTSGGITFLGWRNTVYIDNLTVEVPAEERYANDFDAAVVDPLADFTDVTGDMAQYVTLQSSTVAETDRGQSWKLGSAKTNPSALGEMAYAKRLAGDYTDYAVSFAMKEDTTNASTEPVINVALRSAESNDSGYTVQLYKNSSTGENSLAISKRAKIASGNYEYSDYQLKKVDLDLDRSGWHTYKVAIVDKTIAVWIDGEVIAAAVDDDTTAEWASGGVTFTGWRTSVYIDDLKIETAVAEDMPEVEGVPFVLNKESVRISKGDSTSVSPLYEEISDKGSSFTYESSNAQVATVDNYGIITAVAPGEAIVTCTAVDGATATVTVYVNPVCNTFYYVAPNGSDDNPGTEDAPFATIEKARDTIRDLTLPEGGVTVYLRGGEYYLTETIEFTPADSGEAGKPIAYASYPGEEAIIHSGQRITGFTKLTEDAYPAGLPDAAKGNVYVADVEPGWRFHDLYVDGERQQVARMYNDDNWDTWGTFPVMPASPLTNPSENGMLATFQDGHLDNLPSNGDVELYLLPVVWWNSLPVVTDIDAENNTARLQSYNPSIEPYGVGGTLFQGGGKYNLMNAPKFLDEAGEWCVDSENGKVYWWPQNATQLNRAVAPTLYELVRLQGDEEEQNWAEQVEYIEFRDLTFMYTDRAPENKWNEIFGEDLLVRNAENTDAAIFMQGVANCAVIDSKILYTGTYAIALDHYAKDNRIVRNELGNLGCGGVQLYGYGPGSGKTRNINTRNVVLANNVHDIGLAPYQHSSAITIFGASYTDGKFNTITNMPYTAIMITGTDADSMNPTYNRNGNVGFNGRAYIDTYGNITQYGIREDEILSLGADIYTNFSCSKDNGRSAIPYQSSDYNIMEYNIAKEYMMVMNDGGCYYAWSMGKNNEYNYNVAIKSGYGKGTLFPLYMDDYASYVKLEGNTVWAPQIPTIDKSQSTNIWKNNSLVSNMSVKPDGVAALESAITAEVTKLGGYISTEGGNIFTPAPTMDGITAAADAEMPWRTVVTVPELPVGAEKFVCEVTDNAEGTVYIGDLVSADQELAPAAATSIVALEDAILAVYALDADGGVVAYAYVNIENAQNAETPYEELQYMYEDFEKNTDGTYGPQYEWEVWQGDAPTYVEDASNHVLASDSSNGLFKMYSNLGETSWKDTSMEMEFKLNEWQSEKINFKGIYDCISIMSRVVNDQNNWQLIVRKESGMLELNKFYANAGHNIKQVPFVPEAGVWYKLKMVFTGDQIDCYIAKKDQEYGEPLLTHVDNDGSVKLNYGGVGLNCLGADFQMDNIKVYGHEALEDILADELAKAKAVDTSLYTKESVAQLQEVIAAAEASLSKDGQINAVDALKKSVAALELPVDTTAIDNAIAAANAAKEDVEIVDKEADEVPNGTKFVTTDEMKALTDAIAAAEAAKESAQTADDVAAAAEALNDAVDVFKAAIKTGTVVAQIGDEIYTDLSDALEKAEAGDTVTLVADAEESYVIITPGVTLDLGANILTADYVIGLKGSYITGDVYATGDSAVYGQLVAAKDNVSLSSESCKVSTANGDRYVLPVWNGDAEGYVFGRYMINENPSDEAPNRGFVIDAENDQLSLVFKHKGTAATNGLLKDDGSSNNGVTFLVRITWVAADGDVVSQDYSYSDANVIASMKTGEEAKDFGITFTGYSSCTDIKVTAMMVSDTGVEVVGETHEVN